MSTYLAAKFYISRDSDITWGPKANTGLKISDYDRFNGLFSFKAAAPGLCGKDLVTYESSLSWTFGDSGLKHQSANVDLMLPCRFELLDGWGQADIPFYIRYHVGPMNTLSNYTQFTHGVWAGIKLNTR